MLLPCSVTVCTKRNIDVSVAHTCVILLELQILVCWDETQKLIHTCEGYRETSHKLFNLYEIGETYYGRWSGIEPANHVQ